MYIFKNDTIPVFFPTLEGARLQPWFSVKRLDQGLQLIRDRRISGLHCVRNGVGALIDGETPVTLEYEQSAKRPQDFRIRHRHCGCCHLAANEKGCVHLAALTILSLTQFAGQDQTRPLPFSFADSGWLHIGHFLHQWLGQVNSAVERVATSESIRYEFTASDGSVQVAVPAAWADFGELRRAKVHRSSASPPADSGPAQLDHLLIRQAMTETESTLAQSGHRSIGWERDTSFWVWLARLLFLIHDGLLPELQRDPVANRFLLRAGIAELAGALTIILPRERTWALVRQLPFPPGTLRILPPAKECYRVFFRPDTTLAISPSLRLEDGRILARQDLVANRFAEVYYLEGEGFLPTIRIPAEGIISNQAAATAALAPLFAYAQNEQVRHQPFTIAPNDIPAFLEANHTPLRFADNIVAPELFHLQVRELPDRLVIDDFEEHDDWCYLSCHYGLGNTSIRLEEILLARAEKRACLSGRAWLRLDGTPLSWLHDLTEERVHADGRIRLSYRELLALTSLIPEVKIALEKQSPRQRLTSLLDAEAWTDAASLPDTPAHLRPYQRNGLAWLYRLYRLGIGGLLADDMGLGKTHQALALVQAVIKGGAGGPTLVICPASVLLGWAEKITRFYPDLDHGIYYGPGRNLAEVQDRRLILTTYGIVRQDQELLQPLAFELILLDEIQHLKNPATGVHQAVAALTSRVKIGLSGTPIENSLQDLRALFDICLPGLLGSRRQFEQVYEKPISESSGDNSSVQARERLSRLIHPFLLRRSRSQVLTELPETIDDDRLCELSDDQVGLYRQVIDEMVTDPENLDDGESAPSAIMILTLITRLKQICCHPCLVQDSTDPSDYASGKWDLFVELTEELLAAGMKFVVFSQYTRMLELIEGHLRREGIGFASIKGTMTAGRRQKMIETFNTNPDCRVFCASLLAGGVGIDLTGAEAVIHYDRWWNPAREEQATARVHRMGQKKVVQVFRLITKGTLEEKIHCLLAQKQELATALIQEDEASIIKQLDRRELAELLRLAL